MMLGVCDFLHSQRDPWLRAGIEWREGERGDMPGRGIPGHQDSGGDTVPRVVGYYKHHKWMSLWGWQKRLMAGYLHL